ncbi:MAG: flavin reductase family protein [Candidatus Diapherotrites archaeon]|nr:flavin reductase family protein [Candidatus Diapherotrites archaeon]
MQPSEFVRLIYPRAVAVVTSINSEGIANAAPYSWVCPVSFTPPMLLVGIQNRETRTVRNIRETKEFVVHVVTRDWEQTAIECEKKARDNEDKLAKIGLEKIKSEKVNVPSIKKSKIVMECRLSEILVPKNADHMLVIGEIVAAKTSEPKLEEIVMHLLGEKFVSPGEEYSIERKR